MAGRVGAAAAAAVLSLGAAVTVRAQERALWDRWSVPEAHAASDAAAAQPTQAEGAATAAAASAAGPPARGRCELAGADRAATPSARCVACHDGSVGPGVEFQMGATGHSMSHPVEMDYAASVARQPRRYVPAERLPPDVPLVAGKVACTSCHDGASPDPKHVVNPRGLCQSCHEL